MYLRVTMYPLVLLRKNKYKEARQISQHASREVTSVIKSSQISYIAWKITKIGEASADTAATETYYMKGYYNLEETIKVKIWAAKNSSSN